MLHELLFQSLKVDNLVEIETEMSQDILLHQTIAELFMVFLLPFCRHHNSQSPCFLHIEFHPQQHPVWSGRSPSLSTTVFGKGSGKEIKLQQSEAELKNSNGQEFQNISHCFVHQFRKPYKGCISRDMFKVFHKLGPNKGPNSSTAPYGRRRVYDKYKTVSTFYQVN